MVEDGYKFECDRQLVTVFSAPNYCGSFDNAGAVLRMKENLHCSFLVLPAAVRPSKLVRAKSWD